MSRLKNLYHTTCRNWILEENTTGKSVKLQMWTRKMERERYCELIECNMVICFFSWSLIQNHFPHKMHKGRIDWFVCFFSSSFIQNHIIFHTKCTGAGGWLREMMQYFDNYFEMQYFLNFFISGLECSHGPCVRGLTTPPGLIFNIVLKKYFVGKP